MPTSLDLPFPPLLVIEQDGPVTWEQLEPKIVERLEAGLSVCLTEEKGVPNRGGYFFHIQKSGDNYVFSTFDRDEVCVLSNGEECASFINHVSGRKFDERMWELAQDINLRSD